MSAPPADRKCAICPDDQENSRKSCKCIAICKDDTDAGNETTDKAFTPGSEDNQSVMYRNKM